MFGKQNNIQYEQTNWPNPLWYVFKDYTASKKLYSIKGYTGSNQNITFSNPVFQQKSSGFYLNNVNIKWCTNAC